MAKLKGNDVAEWIKALVPVDPESFKTMAKGTLIINLDSDTMEPDQFERLESDGRLFIRLFAGTPAAVVVCAGLSGWFLFPPPAPEVPIRSTTIGKVKELGDGKWK